VGVACAALDLGRPGVLHRSLGLAIEAGEQVRRELGAFVDRKRPSGLEPRSARRETLTISRACNDHSRLRGAVLPGGHAWSSLITCRVAAAWQQVVY
jgi:hypothetical protein